MLAGRSPLSSLLNYSPLALQKSAPHSLNLNGKQQGAPQQQGAQWPAAAGFQPPLGPYAAYGAYPPMAPRAYPMLMAAPAQQQQAMLAAAPAQQLAPPPPPLPRAAPKDISMWLDEVKPGYGEKYASIFEDLGVDDEEDVQNLRDDLARDLRAALENAGAKRGHLNNIESAVIAKRANRARTSRSCRRRRRSRRRRAPCPRCCRRRRRVPCPPSCRRHQRRARGPRRC